MCRTDQGESRQAAQAQDCIKEASRGVQKATRGKANKLEGFRKVLLRRGQDLNRNKNICLIVSVHVYTYYKVCVYTIYIYMYIYYMVVYILYMYLYYIL